MRSAVCAVAALAALSVAPAALAQDGRGGRAMMVDGTVLSVTAEAEVSRKPDMATITAGVVTDAPTADAALADNARRMSGVMAALKRAGVAERDIQTSQLSVNPQVAYQDGRAPRVTGYQAVNTVTVKLRDLAAVGKTVDALVAEGGNQLNGIAFGLADPDSALDSARSDALKKARARADVYASAAGMRVKRIVSISETGDMPSPPIPMMAMARAAPETPVSPGEISMTARVTVVFELQ